MSDEYIKAIIKPIFWATLAFAENQVFRKNTRVAAKGNKVNNFNHTVYSIPQDGEKT